MDFVTGEMFDEEEKIVLNKLAREGSRIACCEQLLFGMEVTSSQECNLILQAVHAKVQRLTSDEWVELQKYLPYEVSITEDDMDE